MAFYDTVFYCNAGNQSTTGYYAVQRWAASTAVAIGALRRQFTAPALNSERVFVCIVAGTTAASEPSWVVSRAGKTTDGTVTWQEITGIAAMNGDAVNTVTWAQAKVLNNPTLGAIIKRNNGASYQICTTASNMGATEPPFSDTPGVTATEVSASSVWMCLGPVGNFLPGGGAPFAHLQAVISSTNWFNAGNTIFIGNNHAETTNTAQMNLNPAAAVGTVGRCICHNAAGNYPPIAADVTTGASLTTGNAGWGFSIFPTSAGAFYFYGVAFHCAVGYNSQVNISIQPSGACLIFDNCVIDLATTGSTTLTNINIGNGNDGVIIFRDVQVSFGHIAQRMPCQIGQFIWQNTKQQSAFAAGSVAPTYFMFFNNTFTSILLEGLDLSLLGAGSTIVAGNVSYVPGQALIKDCKLGVGMTVGGLLTFNTTCQVVSSANDAAPYKSARYAYEGVETTNTNITRTGGATDPTGQKQSRQILTNANPQWLLPFNAEPYAVWSDKVGVNVTLTVYGIANGSLLPLSDEVWLDVEYHGSPTSTAGSMIRTTKANVLAPGAPGVADASVWSIPTSTITAIAFSATTAVNTSLSNGNLTATHTSTANNNGVSSSTFLTSGKYYFEIKANVMNVSGGWNDQIGAINSVGTVTGMPANSLTIFSATGVAENNGSTFGSSMGVISAGDVISVALDLDNRLGWIRRNGGSWFAGPANNPISLTGGAPLHATAGYAPVVNFATSSAVGSQYTLNSGATAFAYPVPGGYSTVWTPFRLTATLSSPQPGMPGYIHVRPRVAKINSLYILDPQINLS